LYSERVFGLEREASVRHGSPVRVAMKKLLLILTVGLALPGVAQAGTVTTPNVTMVSRDVALGARALQAADAPIRFDMLGLHWQGPGTVAYRTRSLTGRWRAWHTPDADLPQTKPPWHFGNLDWTGESTAVQFRTHGITHLRAYYLSSRVTSAPKRSLSIAGSPTIVPRADWQADEKIVRAHPLYAPALKLAVVHHTAGTNDYTAAEAPAIVRGIEVYHVKGNGWNDIGYNFLVDRYGTVYEGRGGGMTRNVIGAHALGFNAGTVGVSLIGNFDAATPPAVMQTALVNLLAWRLDIAHVDPLSTVAYTSGGNAKFHAGKVVTLRAISGHRDTGPTECPGRYAYALLPSIAQRVALTGLPKLYAPVVSGALGGDVRFQARLSSARAWTISVADTKGTVVARRTGTTQIVDWTWKSAGAGKGPFTWTIASGADVLAATGTLGGTLPQPAPVPAPVPVQPISSLITGLSASPSVLTPAADGSGLVTAVDFALAKQAQITVTVGSLSLLSTLAAPGNDHFEWDLSQLPDGRYPLTVTAKANGRTSTQSVSIVVDRTLSGLVAAPSAFSPNADGSSDTVSFGFSLTQNVPVQVTVQRSGVVVATLFVGQLGPGPQTIGWDGTSAGQHLPDGQYTAVVTATDSLATVSLLVPFAIDTVAPALAAVSGAALTFQLSEPATVSGTINGQAVSAAEPAGTFVFPWTGPPATSWSLQAKDAAGNAGGVLNGP
jgi:N-acetylmuramoyl-L-alanine amidase-like protein/flagellar hook capping protein FlgD